MDAENGKRRMTKTAGIAGATRLPAPRFSEDAGPPSIRRNRDDAPNIPGVSGIQTFRMQQLLDHILKLFLSHEPLGIPLAGQL